MIRWLPLPSRTFMAVTITALFSLDGLWTGIRRLPADDWYVQAASVAGNVVRAGAKGAIIGGLLWLCAKGAENFRLKTPKPWVIKLGLTIYWLGFAVGFYTIGLALYVVVFLAPDYTDAVARLPFQVALNGLFSWFAARAISYALGR